MMTHVILVDENDHPIGQATKLEAHEKGLLHRAFSVFIFNDKHELLIQQRAFGKYHSGGLWTNTCCSHPFVGETTEAASERRLAEEMGFTTELELVTSFIYKAALDNELYEHEFDHVFVGKFNGEPNPNPEEVADWNYISLAELERGLSENPEQYTVWFRIIFSKVRDHITGKA